MAQVEDLSFHFNKKKVTNNVSTQELNKIAMNETFIFNYRI